MDILHPFVIMDILHCLKVIMDILHYWQSLWTFYTLENHYGHFKLLNLFFTQAL